MIKVRAYKNIQDFTLDVAWSSRAPITALFGPSGSGKSLTLQTMAGLVRPQKGFIKVNSSLFFHHERGINLSPQQRRVGFLFQDYALFPHMTVLENVAYGVPKKEKSRAMDLLATFQIDHLAPQYPHQLSGGEKQRVALARALAINPTLLLLDEPFSALHSGLKEILYCQLEKTVETFNTPVVLVTHDLEEVFRLAQHLVLYHQGRVIQEGPPNLVYNRPLHLLAARLMGHKNFLPVSVEGEGKDGIIKARLPGGQTLLGRDASGGRLKPGDRAIALIHPLAIAPTRKTPSFRFKARLESINPRGDFTVLTLNPGHTLELKIQKTLLPNFILEPGREAQFMLSIEGVSLFPEEER